MYTTIIHPLRKMYLLSINEYSVLEAIRQLSNNHKYNGWCVLSVPKLCKALDLSDATIRRAYHKLEEVELIVRRRQTAQDTAVRSSDEWNEWFMPEKAEILLGMKTTNNEILGYVPKPDDTHDRTPIKMNRGSTQIDRATPIKMNSNTNKDTNNNIISTKVDEQAQEKTPLNLSLEDSENPTPSSAAPPSHGNQEINKMLEALKAKIGIQAFVDSAIERNMAKHCVGLIGKIGKDEFVRRLECLLNDSFHSKNCNKIKYIYNNIKGFIEPKQSNYIQV